MFKDNKKAGKRRLLFLVSVCLVLVFILSAFSVIEVSALQGRLDSTCDEVYLGGMPFGLKFSTDGIVVIGFSDIDGIAKTQNPAYLAGIRARDVIIKVNGETVSSAQELTDRVEASGGKRMTVTYLRGQKETTVSLTPIYSVSEDRYKTGMWIKDSGAGIGTVTYIKTNGEFGGLGHGICDGETGALIGMSRGDVVKVNIYAVKKGVSGAPGELKGHFCTDCLGELYTNTDCGVFGRFTILPEGCGEKVKIGTRDQIHEGDAEIVCTLSDGVRARYKVEISAINRSAEGSKCFVIKIKDPTLIEKTGGIVQGMSGSPIIQNGKLVGAVTHVMINDPTMGYGIFIENMLSNMPAKAG